MGQVALKPFVGTIGTALAEAGSHSVVPPRRVGGNLDIRDNCKGTTLYLPVEVAGGYCPLEIRMPLRAMAKFVELRSKSQWMLS